MATQEVSKTSMLFWWPKVKGLHIPVPKTEVVEVPYQHLVGMLDGKSLPDEYKVRIIGVGRQMKYPLFLRTDMGSAKHQWEKTCFVSEEAKLFSHIWALINETLTAGMFGELDPNALVLREYLPMDSAFIAFAGLPISRERRYFIRDGKVECHHPYWPKEAFGTLWRAPSEPDWEERLGALNKESREEVKLLTGYSVAVGRVLSGFWSVDYAKTKDGTWHLIDMAEGEKSWHPAHEDGEHSK